MRYITSKFVVVRAAMVSITLLFFAFTSLAQNPFSFVFNGELVTLEENITTFEWNQMPESSKLAEGYFGWVQFIETPDQQTQNYFKSNDLLLLDYVGQGTYLFYMPETTPISVLSERKVRAIAPVEGRFKLEPKLLNLEIPDYARQGERILVQLEYHNIVSQEYIINDLANQQIEVKQVYDSANFMDLIIPDNCLESLSNSSYVRYVALVPPPPVKEDVQGKSIHRSNGLDTQMSSGWNYTGAGVGVLVRDDGVVGPHIDFQGRIDNIPTSSGGSHGDGVAGIFAGAGNLNPRYRGMAAGSDLYVSNYVSTFLDSPTTSLIADGSVMITNSSYGDGCNGGYTFNARTVDQQTNDHPNVMHVFSCGNSNGNDCGYGAGNQWGNITGGHKQGKNVIATANVFYDGTLVSSSSHGPARDGRIKPDITAHGQGHISTGANNTYSAFGGTSGAAPGVAGVSAQLYELYADTHAGVMPESGLVKAALLNTANDAGNVGPDFKFGWGIVNGLRAGKLLSEDRFIVESISNGELNTNTLTVPSGTTQMRIMVYWTDPAAASGASTALINDLDLVVKDPSDTPYLPWILDPTPDPVTLDLPATNGADHLNNMEQVLINNPAAGDYVVEISGFDVPFGPQTYYIVYEFIQENLTLVYPNYAESVVAGQTEVIHWDAINTTADFVLEYTADDGANWNTIAPVPADEFNYTWTVPEVVSGQVRVRATSGSFSDESDHNFSIAPQTDNILVTQVCDTETTLTWDEVPGAESYDIYVLGTKYMELVGTSADNLATVTIESADNPLWVAIAARNDSEGWLGRRTVAYNHPGTGLFNCSFTNDLSVWEIDTEVSEFNLVCDASPITIKATYLNSGLAPQTDFEISYQFGSDAAVTETYSGTLEAGQLLEYEFSTPLTITEAGDNTLTLSISAASDEDSTNNSEVLNVVVALEGTALDSIETFEETGFPSDGWQIENPDGDTGWAQRSIPVGSDGAATTVGWVNNYIYNAPGEEDIFITEVFEINASAAAPAMVFDLAKAQYSTTLSDRLRVEISTDCGLSFTPVYDKAGIPLSTVGIVTANWTPANADDWRREEIDLSPYLGENVLFRFININGYGNSTYVDNVNVVGNVLGTPENQISGLVMYPNPTDGVVNLTIQDAGFGDMSVKVINALGQMVWQQNNISPTSDRALTMDLSGLNTGIYFVKISIDGNSMTKKLVVR